LVHPELHRRPFALARRTAGPHTGRLKLPLGWRLNRGRSANADLADKRNQLRIAQSVNDPRAIAAEEVDNRRFAVAQGDARLAEAEAGVAQAEAKLAETQAQLDLLVDPKGGGDGADIQAASDRVVYLSDGRIDDIKRRDQLDIQFGQIAAH